MPASTIHPLNRGGVQFEAQPLTVWWGRTSPFPEIEVWVTVHQVHVEETIGAVVFANVPGPTRSTSPSIARSP